MDQDQLLQKENNINYSNKQSTLDTNKNSILFYNNGNYFSFGKDNSLTNKIAPNTSSFNIKENIRKSDNININNTSFLNKKRKLMTSEELELEQIERERKEVKKMMQKNMALYYRTKSGTTTIVSKIRDNIYSTNNNINKNAILNNYIQSNTNNTVNINNKFNCPVNQNINKNNSYVMNFLKEKGINKNNNVQKIVDTNNNINKTEISKNSPKKEIIEIINTDINIDNEFSVNEQNDIKKGDIIGLDEEKEKEEIYKDEEDNNNNNIEKEPENENIEKEEIMNNLVAKTPNKESSYLVKIKQLGSMSKLSLCNKIQKYTEICQEVLKEQENGEENDEEKEKPKKGQKQKKNKKKSNHKK